MGLNLNSSDKHEPFLEFDKRHVRHVRIFHVFELLFIEALKQ